MLTKYQISNFKAFSEADELLLKPITLIYGPNSSGKSSIIQSLLLLKQTLQEAENSDTSLKPKGRLVDLGNYREFIHLHDVSRHFIVKTTFESESLIANISDKLHDVEKLRDALDEFSSLSLQLTFNQSLPVGIRLSSVELMLDDVSAITYEVENNLLTLVMVNSEHIYWQALWQSVQDRFLRAVLQQINKILTEYGFLSISSRSKKDLNLRLKKSLDLIRGKLDELQEKKRKVEQELEELKIKRSHEDENLMNFRRQEIDPLTQRRKKIQEDLEKGTNDEDLTREELEKLKLQVENELEQAKQREVKLPFYECEKIVKDKDSENSGIDNEIRRIDQLLDELDPMIDLAERAENYEIEQASIDIVKVMQHPKIACQNFIPTKPSEVFSDEDSDLRNLQEIYQDLLNQYQLSDLTLIVSSKLKDFLESISYIGPLRDYPERFYIFSASERQDVGKSGGGMGNLLFQNPDFLAQVNSQLKQFELGYELKTVAFRDDDSSESSDVYALRLIDSYNQTQVNLLDIGFGVSQVLPVIVQSMFAQQKVILIEQPEIHIHPRLQTQLGSLFAESIKAPLNNRFIIETHSEHLILRLQRLIRQGELSCDDVSVIYVERTSEGSQCLQLRLDEEGDFIDEWPGGFFEENFNEIFN